MGIKFVPKLKKWRYSYYSPSGRYIRRLCDSRKEAESLLAKAKVEILEGKYLEVKPQSIPFHEAVKQFLEWSNRSKSAATRKLDVLFAKEWLDSPHLDKTLDTITGRDIELFRADLGSRSRYEGMKKKDGNIKGSGKLSKRRIQMSLGRLKRLFSLSVQWGLVAQAPKIVLGKEEYREHHILTVEEEESLLEHCDPDLRAMVILALNTGMRLNEILTLGRTSLDMEAREIRIFGQNTKTRKGRIIPMNEKVHGVCKSILTSKSKAPLAFKGPSGSGIKDFQRRWALARKRANLPSLRFHDLRHTAATRLIKSGANLFAVQRVLGHSTLNMVRRYAETDISDLRDALKLLSGGGGGGHEGAGATENQHSGA